MPGQVASSGRANTTPQALPRKRLYMVDAKLTPASPVTDIRNLVAVATGAVEAGQGHVLRTDYVVFPNGAVTLVLILAESHLSIHTWPEEDLIAIDLFSCGAIDGARVIGQLTDALRLDGARLRQAYRGICAGP